MKLIYLAHEPSRGLIRLFDRDIATLPRAETPAIRRRMGVVFQDYRLLDHLTVFDNAAPAAAQSPGASSTATART